MHAPSVTPATVSSGSAYEFSNPSLRNAFAANGDGGRLLAGTDEKRLRDLEAYMKRHPCILDTSSEFLDAHPELYPTGVLLGSLSAIAVTSWVATDMGVGWFHFAYTYLLCALNITLYISLLVGDPGYVNPCKHVHSGDTIDHLPAQMILIASAESLPDYCAKCHSCRPVRAHHCKRCARCVDLMDHHCPWLGRCVGARNIKHFTLYLLYTLILALYAFALFTHYFFRWSYDAADTPSGVLQRENWDWYWPFYVLAYGLVTGGVCAASYLLLRSLYLAARGITGIELAAKHKPRNKRATTTATTTNTNPATASVGTTDTPHLHIAADPATPAVTAPGEALMNGAIDPRTLGAVAAAAGGVIPIFEAVAVQPTPSVSSISSSAGHSAGGGRGWYANFADTFTHPSRSRPVQPTPLSWLGWLVPFQDEFVCDLRVAYSRISPF